MSNCEYKITKEKKEEWMNKSKEWLVSRLAEARRNLYQKDQREKARKYMAYRSTIDCSILETANANMAKILEANGIKPKTLEVTYLYRDCDECNYSYTQNGKEWYCDYGFCEKCHFSKCIETISFYSYSIDADNGFMQGIISSFKSLDTEDWLEVERVVDLETGRIIYQKENDNA